jgi:hypothetical protein
VRIEVAGVDSLTARLKIVFAGLCFAGPLISSVRGLKFLVALAA